MQGNLLANDDAGAQLTGVSFLGNVGVLNDGVWTITDGSGIWSLAINSTSGAYEFNLLQPFSHTLPGADTASLVFDYQIASDVASTLTIAVVDDTPSIGWDGSLYQASVQSISTLSEEIQSVNKNTQDFEQDKGYVLFDFGADGPSQDSVVAPLRFAGIALSGDYIDFQYDGRSDNYEYAESNNFHILVSSDGQFVEGYTDSEGESDSLAFTMLLGDSGDYLFQQSSDQFIKGENAMTFTIAAQDYEGDIASTNIIVDLNLVSDALHAQLEYQII